MASSKFQAKNTVLTKKLNNVLYELMVKTNSDMVYVDDSTTLTERLVQISDLFTAHELSYLELKKQFEEVVGDANSNFDSFREIWDYINVDGNPKSALIQLIDSKQASEEGKGLSECDFTTMLRDKLENDYTKEQLDEKFRIIIEEAAPKELIAKVEVLEKKPNTVVSETASGEDYNNLTDNSCWYQVVSKDTAN